MTRVHLGRMAAGMGAVVGALALLLALGWLSELLPDSSDAVYPLVVATGTPVIVCGAIVAALVFAFRRKLAVSAGLVLGVLVCAGVVYLVFSTS